MTNIILCRISLLQTKDVTVTPATTHHKSAAELSRFNKWISDMKEEYRSAGNAVPASSQIYHPSYLPPCHIFTPAYTVATNVMNAPAESISPTSIPHSSTSISTNSTNNINYQYQLDSPLKKKSSYH